MQQGSVKTEVLYRPPDTAAAEQWVASKGSDIGTVPNVIPTAPSEFVPSANLVTFFSHSRPVTHVSFSSIYPQHTDDKPEYNLLTASKDSLAYVLKGPTSDWVGTLCRHKGAVWQVRQYGNTDYVATASADMSAQLHDIYSGKLLASLPHKHVVKSVSFSTDIEAEPSRLATGAMNKEVRIYDVRRATETGTDSEPGAGAPFTIVGQGEHKDMVRSVVWTADRNILLSSCDDRQLRWWDVRTPGRSPVRSHEVGAQVGSCEIDGGYFPSESCLISVAADKEVIFFDPVEPGKVVNRFETADKALMKSVAVSPKADRSDRRIMVTGMDDTTVRVWDWQTGEVLHKSLSYHHGPVWTVAFSPDGREFATGSEDGTVRLWKCCEGPFGLWQ